MKKGLVLEGGGMRGLFTAGFLDVLIENGIQFDGMFGISAGVLFGCNYKSRQAGRSLRYNLQYKDDARYMSIRSLITTGDYVNVDFAYNIMPRQLDPFDEVAFANNPMKFYVGCTDIVTGKPVYKRIDDMDDRGYDWFRASAAMPLMAKPVEIEGHIMLDGGIVDSIPLKYAQSIGYEKNLVVLTQPKGYKKKPFKATWLFKYFLPKYPKVAKLMAQRHIMYNQELDFVYKEGRKDNTLLVIPDESLNIGRVETNGKRMRQCYAKGRTKALEMLDDIKRFLE